MLERYGKSESAQYAGLIIAHLAQSLFLLTKLTLLILLFVDPSLMRYSGKIISTVDYGESYGVPDIDGEYLIVFSLINKTIFLLGQYPTNIRSVAFLISQVPGLKWLSGWIPRFIKIPYWLFHQASNKF